MRIFNPLILLLLVLIPLCVGCCGPFMNFSNPKVWISEEEDLSFDAAGLDALAVNTYNGHIHIKAAPESQEIAVHLIKKAGGKDLADARASMDAIQIIHPVTGTTQQLDWESKQKKQKNWGQSVSFEILVSPSFRIQKANTYNGEIILEEMNSGADLVTYNGNIHVKGLDGDLKLVTYNGDVWISHSEGQVSAESYNGHITITSSSTRMNAQTYNGWIKGDFSAVSSFHGDFSSYNGSINLRLKDQPSVRFSCKTENGEIDVAHPSEISIKRKGRLEGKIGKGEGSLEVNTYNGSITID